jgi:hypothetical protein
MSDSNEKIRINDMNKLDTLKNALRDVVESVKSEISKEGIIETFTKLLEPEYREQFANYINNLNEEQIETMGKRLQKNIKRTILYFRENSIEKKISNEIPIKRFVEEDDLTSLTEFEKYLTEIKDTIRKVAYFNNRQMRS